MTTREILDALHRRYQLSGVGGGWLGIEELRCGAGYSTSGAVSRDGVESRIDFFAIHAYPSKQHHRIAFEVKVSRADFRKEVKDPTKRRMALMFSNEYYFVTPPNLVQLNEIPPECGLMTYHADSDVLHTSKRAPWRDSQPPTWTLFASALRAERSSTPE